MPGSANIRPLKYAHLPAINAQLTKSIRSTIESMRHIARVSPSAPIFSSTATRFTLGSVSLKTAASGKLGRIIPSRKRNGTREQGRVKNPELE